MRPELFPGVTIVTDETNGDERFADRRGSGQRVAQEIEESISPKKTKKRAAF